jgi:preprotein translocase subunit SecD
MMTPPPALAPLVLCLALGGCSKQARNEPAGAIPPVILQFVLIDDKVDPFERPIEPLPEGVSVQRENVYTTPEAPGPLHYVRLVKSPGETDARAKERIAPWLAQHPLPPGRSFGFSDSFDKEDKTNRAPSALRTYTLTGSPELTNADVVDASVTDVAGAGPDRSSAVRIKLAPGSVARFFEFTRAHTKERFAIVVNGKIQSAPLITGAISGENLILSMSSSGELARAEAERIAVGLRGNRPGAGGP